MTKDIEKLKTTYYKQIEKALETYNRILDMDEEYDQIDPEYMLHEDLIEAGGN